MSDIDTGGSDDDVYTVLRRSHPMLRSVDQASLAQFMVFVTVWMRHYELQRQDAIFTDPFIVPLAQDVGEALLKFFPDLDGNREIANYANLRAYCADNALMRRDPVMHQVVIIAGGLDTRAFRIEQLADCTVFEIHTNPAIMQHKEQVFVDLGVKPTAKDRIVLFAHFHDNAWRDTLLQAGLDPKQPTYWILESTLHFIAPDEVMPLIRGIDALSAPKSQLFTERVLGGGLDLDLDEQQQVALTIHTGLRYGEDGGVFRDLNWNVELLLRRNQAFEYYGTMWDSQRFDRFRVTGSEASAGPWFVALFTKPE